MYQRELGEGWSVMGSSSKLHCLTARHLTWSTDIGRWLATSWDFPFVTPVLIWSAPLYSCIICLLTRSYSRSMKLCEYAARLYSSMTWCGIQYIWRWYTLDFRYFAAG